MTKRTMQLVRQLADLRRAQHCTALRAARQAAEADAELARAADQPAPPEAPRDDDDPPEADVELRLPSQ